MWKPAIPFPKPLRARLAAQWRIGFPYRTVARKDIQFAFRCGFPGSNEEIRNQAKNIYKYKLLYWSVEVVYSTTVLIGDTEISRQKYCKLNTIFLKKSRLAGSWPVGYLQSVEELDPQNECQPTFHDGINLGAGRKEKTHAQRNLAKNRRERKDSLKFGFYVVERGNNGYMYTSLRSLTVLSNF